MYAMLSSIHFFIQEGFYDIGKHTVLSCFIPCVRSSYLISPEGIVYRISSALVLTLTTCHSLRTPALIVHDHCNGTHELRCL